MHASGALRCDDHPHKSRKTLNFYLKAAEAGHRGFEFTHKSFGDYLAARAILDIACELPQLINRKVDHAMTDWLAATGTGSLSLEVLSFLRDEVRLRVTDNSNPERLVDFISLKTAFERFVSVILGDGLPAQTGGTSWRAAESRQANAETMAWAVLNALSLTLAHLNCPEKYINVEWPDNKTSLGHLIRRMSGKEVGAPALQCFSYIVAPGAELATHSLVRADFRGAKMPGSNFWGPAYSMPTFRMRILTDAYLLELFLIPPNLMGHR